MELKIMDPNMQQRSIDGVKPRDGIASTATPRTDNYETPNQPNDKSTDQTVNNKQDAAKIKLQDSKKSFFSGLKTKDSNKSIRVLLVVFIVLFMASATTAVMFYLQYDKAKDSEEDYRSKYNQSIQNASVTSNKANDDKATLETKITAKDAYIRSLTDAAQRMQTACGRTCTAISIPENTTVSANNNP